MQEKKKPEVIVGDEREEVCIRNAGDGNAVLVAGQYYMRDISLGLLRSIHHAAGAYLALVK